MSATNIIVTVADDALRLGEIDGFLARARAEFEKAALDLREWEHQGKPCTGSGYAHSAHGACPGYAYDRT